ncbi:MAG: hypothetical protein HC809_09530 [Gammaproteobacteria bacterium]|nr:hypothetical protein [Gammaproteobacteria bacterium]
MTASYEEKSAAGSLLIVLITYAWYAYTAFDTVAASATDLVGLIIGVIVLTVIAEVIYESALAIYNSDTRSDERDRLIAALAGRAESAVLATGVVCTIGYTLVHPDASTMTVHLLMFSLGLGEVAKRIWQLYYYRRGV